MATEVTILNIGRKDEVVNGNPLAIGAMLVVDLDDLDVRKELRRDRDYVILPDSAAGTGAAFDPTVSQTITAPWVFEDVLETQNGIASLTGMQVYASSGNMNIQAVTGTIQLVAGDDFIIDATNGTIVNGPIGLNGATPVGQAAAIAAPTDLASALVAINELRAVLADLGVTA